jgi:predicted dehydrogenase
MKVLVVGYGSIGRRHVSNLKTIDCIENITVFTKIRQCLGNSNLEERVVFVDSLDFLETYSPNFKKIDFAIVANETYKHVDSAILLAEKGIHLFIEKPLSHNLEKISSLREIAQRERVKIFIGYNLRFLGALKYMKEQLSQNIVGNLYFAKIEVGQYLPSWRKNIDYRESYSARAEKGGGVGLDLSHEIDYMRYLFGDPFSWRIRKGKVSELEIDSDDIFEGIYQYRNGFICSVHMDYLEKDIRREMRIVGSRGTAKIDFAKKLIRIKNDNGNELTINGQNLFDFDRTYLDEISQFIEAIKENKEPNVTLDDGIEVLRLLEESNV